MIFHVSFHLGDGTIRKSDSRRQVRLPLWSRIAGCRHCAQGHKGFIIAESQGTGRRQKRTHRLTFEVTPVMNDEQLARVIA
jgi:hypothetical protein